MIPYTSIPLISACFLVLVGVLIGHFIWYRYRDEQQQKTADLHRTIDELQSSLNVQTSDSAEARLRRAEVEGMLSAERETMAELEARLASNESLYESAAADLENSEELNQRLRDQLARQEQELGKLRAYTEQAAANAQQLEDQLSQHSAAAAEELQVVRAQLETSSEAHTAIAQQLAQREARLAELEDSHRTWQERADAATAEVTRLTDLLQLQEVQLNEQACDLKQTTSLRQERNQLQVTLDQTEQQLESLREESSVSIRQLSEQVTELTRSNAELERSEREYAKQLEMQVKLSNGLSEKIDSALSDLVRLNERAAELQTVKADRDRLIDELDERQDQLKRLTHELERMTTADTVVRQQLHDLQQDCEGLQHELKQRSTHSEETSDQLRQAEERRQVLERSLAAASEEVAQLQVERERLEGIEDEVVELDARRRELSKELELVKRERDEALGAESSTREIVAELRDELSDRLESVQLLEDQRNDAVTQLAQERSKSEAARGETVQAHRQLEKLQGQLQSLQQRHDQNLTELHRRDAELESAKNLYAQVASQVTMYRQENQESRGSSSPPQPAVAGERADHPARPARRKSGFSFRRAQRRENDVRAKEQANSRRDPGLGLIYTAAPLRCDDLTKIQGIDDKVHSQLNSLGIYTFKQVMEWSTEATAAFGQRLGTDRIVADDWAGQARRLYHRHYPAAA